MKGKCFANVHSPEISDMRTHKISTGYMDCRFMSNDGGGCLWVVEAELFYHLRIVATKMLNSYIRTER